MPKYLWTGSYTAEGARGVLKEGGAGRRAAVQQLVESAGGKLESFYYAFGGSDFFITIDLPNNAVGSARSCSWRPKTSTTAENP